MKPYYSEAGITIYHGDCREILPLLGGIGAFVSDPPYGMDYKPLRGADGSKRWVDGIQGDSEEFDPSFLLDLPCVLWGGELVFPKASRSRRMASLE